MEQQSFLYSNTHYSDTHWIHDNTPVATDWQLCVPSSRPSGFEMYKDLGHTNYYGQTTLDMYSGGVMDKPAYLDNYSYLNNYFIGNNNSFNPGMNDW